MGMHPVSIDNGQDIMDSRDVIQALEDMETERQNLLDAIDESEDDADIDDAKRELADWDDANLPDLEALRAFCEEGEGATSDWVHGATCIADSYFVEYAQQFAEDIGAINREASWPNDCIDWDKAAEELQQDYTSIEFDGVTYWVR